MKGRKEVLAWLSGHHRFYLATLDGDQPRVRVFGSAVIIDDRLHFFMGTAKDVYRQVIANPKVELCFYDPHDGHQVRVSGAAAPVTDAAVWSVVFEAMPSARSIVERRGQENVALFCIEKAKAHVWTKHTTDLPKEYVDL